MHHSDQLYVPESTRLLYPSPLIVFSKCQEQTNRRRGHTSHLATMRPNAKQVGETRRMATASALFLFFSFFTLFPRSNLQALNSPRVLLFFFFVFDIVMHSLPRWPPRRPSNYTSPQKRKSDRVRAPLHPGVRYHITPWYYCGLRPQAESSTVINLVGFDSMGRE